MKSTTTKAVRVVVTLAASIALVACGGSDDGDGGDSPQDGVADLLIEAAEDAGADVDSDCVRETAQSMSDDDANLIVDAGLDGDPDISETANEVLAEMLLCEN